MRKSKFSESQMAEILKEAEAGVAVADIARKHGISARRSTNGDRSTGG
jgi:putative transposase